MHSSRALLAAAATASQIQLLQKQQAAPFLFRSTLSLLRFPHALSNSSYQLSLSARSLETFSNMNYSAPGSPSNISGQTGNSSYDDLLLTCLDQPVPATWETVVGVCVAVGMFISYLPQVIKIFSRRSSEGLSAYYLLLGEISCFSVFSNSIVLQYEQLECCSINGAGWCAASLLSSAQLGVQFVMFSIMYLSFYIFYPSNLKFEQPVNIYTSNALDNDSSDNESETNSLNNPTSHLLGGREILRHKGGPKRSSDWKTAIGTSIAFVVYFILCGVIMAAISLALGPKSMEMRTFAAGLGLVSMIVSVFMYLPQIVRTWRSQEPGALSIVMMCIQTPGTVVLTLFLATRPGASWSTWLTYVATGTLQAILLAMCIYLTIKKKRTLKNSRPMFFDEEDDYETDWHNHDHLDRMNSSPQRGLNRSTNVVHPGGVKKDEVLR